MVSASSRKSLEPGLLRIKSQEGSDVLVGSQCQKCQRRYFPFRKWCAACSEPTCETIELSHEGTLASFTLVARKSAHSLIEPPYVLGEVLLPVGIRIYTTINLQSDVSSKGVKVHSTIGHDNLDSLKIGGEVRLSPIVVKRDEEGHDIVAYNFEIVR